jgi:hypothetical protein
MNGTCQMCGAEDVELQEKMDNGQTKQVCNDCSSE